MKIQYIVLYDNLCGIFRKYIYASIVLRRRYDIVNRYLYFARCSEFFHILSTNRKANQLWHLSFTYASIINQFKLVLVTISESFVLEVQKLDSNCGTNEVLPRIKEVQSHCKLLYNYLVYWWNTLQFSRILTFLNISIELSLTSFMVHRISYPIVTEASSLIFSKLRINFHRMNVSINSHGNATYVTNGAS